MGSEEEENISLKLNKTYIFLKDVMKSEVEDVMESHMPKPDKPLFSQLGQFCNFCFKKSEITFDMASLSLSISARFL